MKTTDTPHLPIRVRYRVLGSETVAHAAFESADDACAFRRMISEKYQGQISVVLTHDVTQQERIGELTVREGRATAKRYPAADRAPYCRASLRKYACTREAAHPGPHVAHGPDGSALVIWGQVQDHLGDTGDRNKEAR